MTFDFTEQDIEDAKRFGLDNVLLYMASNRTGTLWRMTQSGSAVEIMAPYRSLRFYQEDKGEWVLYPLTGHFAPCVLQAEVQQLNPLDTSPQSEVFIEALRKSERNSAPVRDGLVKLAYRFFEARARDGKSEITANNAAKKTADSNAFATKNEVRIQGIFGENARLNVNALNQS